LPEQRAVRNIESWWRYGNRTGCHALAITSWCPVYSPIEWTFLVNAAAADLWLDSESEFDPQRQIANGLRRLYGSGAGRWGRLIRQLDADHRAGYWNYQIVRSRLVKTAIVEAGDRLGKKVVTYGRLAARITKHAPVTLADTFTIRQYHLAKERLSTSGSGLVFEARQAFAAGNFAGTRRAITRVERLFAAAASQAPPALAATQALWRAARYTREPNPLAQLIEEDIKEHQVLRRFLGKCAKNLGAVMDSNPLLARRQLLVTVRNRKPCLQGFAVEVSTDGTDFKEIHRLWLLEFSGDAGQPRTNFVRTHTIAIPDEIPAGTITFRFKSTGIGELEIRKPVLLDHANPTRPSQVLGSVGRVEHPLRILDGGWTLLGVPAPRHGLPTTADFQTDNHLDVAIELAKSPGETQVP